jgi:integrase
VSATEGLTAEQLRTWLARHPDTTPGTAVATMDRRLSLSSKLVRAAWRGRHTLAVGSDVAPVVRTGALLDLISWHISAAPPPGIDPSTVTLLPAHTTQESSDAIRVLSGALTSGPRVQLPPIRLPDLRHGSDTLSLSAGVDIKVVQEMLGHSTSAFTRDVYTPVVPEIAAAAAEAVAAIVPRKGQHGEPP